MKQLCILRLMFGLATWGAIAQPAPLTFEVASVKRSPQGCEPDGSCPVGFMIQPGGGLRVTGATLKLLLAFAYNVRPFQVSGGPSWINSDRFAINARAGHSEAEVNLPSDPRQSTDDQLQTSLKQVRERLTNLLTDRFRLAVHHDSKEGPVYELVVAKDGPKLQPGKEGRLGIRTGRGLISGRGVDLLALSSALSEWAGRTVIDRTGITGNYDIELKWGTQAAKDLGPPVSPSPDRGPVPPLTADDSSFFTAIQEQLGLKLESAKGSVPTIVIDHVEKVSED